MTTTTKRHHWTKQELMHLKRTVNHSKNRTEAFKKIADEMDLKWESVRSTYTNHFKTKPAAKKATDRTPSFKKTEAKPATTFSKLSDSELSNTANALRDEIERRAKIISDLQALYSH